MIPGEIITQDGEIVLNAGRHRGAVRAGAEPGGRAGRLRGGPENLWLPPGGDGAIVSVLQLAYSKEIARFQGVWHVALSGEAVFERPAHGAGSRARAFRPEDRRHR